MKRKTSFLERAALRSSLMGRGQHFLAETIWQVDLARVPAWKRYGVLALRVLYLVGRAFVSSRAQNQASSLTYVTMLAIVPAFAVIFAIFEAWKLQGTDEKVKQFLISVIAPTPDQYATIQTRIDELVHGAQQHVKTGSGIAGVALIFLVLTVVSLLSSVEKTLNDVWGVKRSRSFIQKFMTYWAVATLGPVLLGIGLVAGSNLHARLGSVSPTKIYKRVVKGELETISADKAAAQASTIPARTRFVQTDPVAMTWSSEAKMAFIFTGEPPDPEDEQRASLLTSFSVTAIAFVLLYAFMPNTRVRIRPAIVGGVIAAGAWQLSKWALASSSSSLVSYNTIYGGLATIPIMMFWLYLTWIIVILGAEITFAIQHVGSQGKEELAADASPGCREVVSLRVMAAIAQAFDRGARPPTIEDLATRIGAPHALISAIVFHLCEDGLLREIDTTEEEHGYVPARPLGRVSLSDVLASVRDRDGINFALEGGADAAFIAEQMARARAAHEAISDQVSLEEVVRVARGEAPRADATREDDALPEPARVPPPARRLDPAALAPAPREEAPAASPATAVAFPRPAAPAVSPPVEEPKRPSERLKPVGAGDPLALAALLDGADMGIEPSDPDAT